MDETRNILINIKTLFDQAGAQQAKSFVKSFAKELRESLRQAMTGEALDVDTAQASNSIGSLVDKIKSDLGAATKDIDIVSAIRRQTDEIVRLLNQQSAARRQAKQEESAAAAEARRVAAEKKQSEKEIANAAKQAAAEEKQAARAAAAELKKQEKELKNISASWGRYRGAVGQVVGVLKQFGSATNSVSSGIKSVHSAISTAANKFNIFDTIFGRVTVGMLTWQAWRSIVGGFQAINQTILKSNTTMQNAFSTFTALSGGSEKAAGTFIEILRQFSTTTGASFDDLLEGARRLPSKIGENYQAFERLVKVAITLSRIDPVQGLSGAFFALTNALEGGSQGLRSLIQRFEIGTVKEFNDALGETGDQVTALEKLLQDQGVNSEKFLAATRNNFDVVVVGIKNMATEFLRLSTEPAFSAVTKWLADLRDWMQRNQVAVQALAQAIGQRLLNGLRDLGSFLRDVVFAGQDLSASGIFETIAASIGRMVDFIHRAVLQIINFVTSMAWAFSTALGFLRTTEKSQAAADNFRDQANTVDNAATKVASAGGKVRDTVSRITADTKKLIPATQQFVKNAKDVLSSLLGIKEGGKETIGKMVEGLTEGLKNSDLKGIHDAILDSVIDLEGQELAQEKSIKSIEKWVSKAADELEAAQKRLKLFDLITADVPERYTRARRRQLELEVLKAEEERDARQASLEAAKEQLEATKAYLAAQREVLATIKSISEAQSGGNIDRGFTPPTQDIESFKNEVESLVGVMDGKINPLIEKIKSLFSDIGGFIRGLTGADPAGEITDVYTAGKLLATSLGNIGQSIKTVIDWVKKFGDASGSTWDNIPDGMKAALLVALGVAVTPLSNLLVLTLNILFGGANAAIWLITTIAKAGLPFNMNGSVIMRLAMSGGKAVTWLVTALAGAGAATLGLAAGVIAASVVVYLLWDDQTAYDWLSGKNAKKVQIILLATIGETLQKVLDFFNAPITLDIEGAVKQQVGQMESGDYSLAPPFAVAPLAAANPGIAGMFAAAKTIWGTTADWIKGDKSLAQAATDNVDKSIIQPFRLAYDAIIGNSIIPDLVRDVISEMTSLSTRIAPPMEEFKMVMLGYSSQISSQWVADFDMMSAAAQRAITLTQQAQLATRSAQATTLSGTAGAKTLNANIVLNAKETNRIMREGVYQGISEVFS